MTPGTCTDVVAPSGTAGTLTVLAIFPGNDSAVHVEVARTSPRGATDHRVWVDLLGRVVKLDGPLTPCDLELLAAGVHELLEPEAVPA